MAEPNKEKDPIPVQMAKNAQEWVTTTAKDKYTDVNRYVRGAHLSNEQIKHLEKPQGTQEGEAGTAGKPNIQCYHGFVEEMKKKRGAWEKAIEKNHQALKDSYVVGTKRKPEFIDTLNKIKSAQREYFALIECALDPQLIEQGKVVPYLSATDWDMLAGVNPGDSKREEKIKEFKEDHYGPYRGIVSEDQYKRATQLVQGGMLEGIKRYWKDEDFNSYLNKNWFNNEGSLVSFAELYGEEAAKQYMTLISAGLHVGDILALDIASYAKLPGKTDAPGLITELPTLKSTFDAVAKATQFAYHEDALRHREYRVRKDARSKYGDDTAAGFNEIDDKRQKLLKKVEGNADGPPFSINGVKFSQSASVVMYKMRMCHPLDFAGFGWGKENRMLDVARLVKSWVEATADANHITPEQVLLMYAKSKKVMVKESVKKEDGTEEEKLVERDNQNLQKNPDGSLGQPINELNINGFPMNGGKKASIDGLADLCAVLDALGIAHKVDMNAIQESQPQSENLRNVAYKVANDDDGWAKYEDKYKGEAYQRFAEKYGVRPVDTAACETIKVYLFDQLKTQLGIGIEEENRTIGGVGMGESDKQDKPPVKSDTIVVNNDASRVLDDDGSGVGAMDGSGTSPQVQNQKTADAVQEAFVHVKATTPSGSQPEQKQNQTQPK